MSGTQSGVGVYRAQFKQLQDWFGGTMEGVTEAVAHYVPPGSANPIAGLAAHTLSGVDFFIVGSLAGKTPLSAGSFAGKTGISEPPPQSGDWAEWARRVRVDVGQLLEYSKALFGEVDQYLATLSDTDLEREVEFPFGRYPVSWALNIVQLDTYCHTGEISCIKGLQGLKGYPM